MTTLQTDSVINANIKVNNLNDTSRAYDIQCSAVINRRDDTETGHLSEGSVNDPTGKTVATFQRWRTVTTTFLTSDMQQQQDILAAIQRFITDIDTYLPACAVTVAPPEE